MLVHGCASSDATRAVAPPPASLPLAQRQACSVGDSRAALGGLAERPSSSVIEELGTGIDAYHLRDGVWLAHAPVLVNEEFDFTMAMSLGAIGAGLAARQRADHNAARARQL